MNADARLQVQTSGFVQGWHAHDACGMAGEEEVNRGVRSM
jgi:hypothetical protein